LENKHDLQMYGLDGLERRLPRYHALMTSDGGTFACCIANGMTGAVRCVGPATMSDFAGAVPEGGRKAGLRGLRQNDLAVDATKNDLHERRLPMARKGPRPPETS
jgi:hypothetical protein